MILDMFSGRLQGLLRYMVYCYVNLGQTVSKRRFPWVQAQLAPSCSLLCDGFCELTVSINQSLPWSSWHPVMNSLSVLGWRLPTHFTLLSTAMGHHSLQFGPAAGSRLCSILTDQYFVALHAGSHPAECFLRCVLHCVLLLHSQS